MVKQKKTTTKKTTTRKAKKTTRKKAAVKVGGTPTEASETVTATTSVIEAPLGEEAAPPPAKPKRRQKATRRKTAKKKAKTTKREKKVDVTESAPATDAPPASEAFEVEKSEEAIIIRFPPVAPEPFAGDDQEPTQDSSVTEATRLAEEEFPAGKLKLSEPVAPDSDTVAADDPELLGTETDVAEPRLHVEEPPESIRAPAPVGEPSSQAGEVKSTRKKRRRRKKPKLAVTEPEEVGEASEPDTPSEEGPTQISPSKKRRQRRQRRAKRAQTIRTDGETQPRAASPTVDEASPVAEESLVPVAEAGTALETEAPTSDEQTAVKRTGRRRRRRSKATRTTAEAISPPEEEPPATLADGATKEMIINVAPYEECRIAILHKGKLEEMYIERASAENHVGNIYKGIITNIEPSIQAAFVDFGLGKNGFLHVSDLHPQHFPDGGAPAENVGRKMPRRSRPPIQRCLRRGGQVIVQITKEGIGTKGPTLSTYLSIPGRFLVMMPGMRRLGVSRKIEDDEVRVKLRSQLDELELPDGMGFIARTAAQDRTKRELQTDLKYLTRLWVAVNKRIENEQAPAELYRESDLVIRTIRDVYSPEIGRIVVDDPVVAKRAREFLHIFSPRSSGVVVEYNDPEPIFHKRGIEAELERLHSRHVPLASGGSLVIDQTEALVAIDVNSGRFRSEDDAESTAYKINLEAANEIARQLRLRDLGGVIVCDFIDMRQESHKRAIERCLARNLKEHKERAKILRTSDFGIIEMTRQRQRASLTRSVYQDCRHCRGTGLVKTPESVALDVMRTIQLNIIRDSMHIIEVTVSTEVAMLLMNRKRAQLHELETKNRRTIVIRPEPSYGLDQVEIRCYDHRGRLVPQA